MPARRCGDSKRWKSPADRAIRFSSRLCVPISPQESRQSKRRRSVNPIRRERSRRRMVRGGLRPSPLLRGRHSRADSRVGNRRHPGIGEVYDSLSVQGPLHEAAANGYCSLCSWRATSSLSVIPRCLSSRLECRVSSQATTCSLADRFSGTKGDVSEIPDRGRDELDETGGIERIQGNNCGKGADQPGLPAICQLRDEFIGDRSSAATESAFRSPTW